MYIWLENTFQTVKRVWCDSLFLFKKLRHRRWSRYQGIEYVLMPEKQKWTNRCIKLLKNTIWLFLSDYLLDSVWVFKILFFQLLSSNSIIKSAQMRPSLLVSDDTAVNIFHFNPPSILTIFESYLTAELHRPTHQPLAGHDFTKIVHLFRSRFSSHVSWEGLLSLAKLDVLRRCFGNKFERFTPTMLLVTLS